MLFFLLRGKCTETSILRIVKILRNLVCYLGCTLYQVCFTLKAKCYKWAGSSVRYVEAYAIRVLNLSKFECMHELLALFKYRPPSKLSSTERKAHSLLSHPPQSACRCRRNSLALTTAVPRCE